LVVIRDCCADPDAEVHAMLLDIVIAKQAVVVTTAELAGALPGAVQTGPETFEVDGNFTIRGVANPEKLTLTVSGKGMGQARLREKWSSTVRTTG
jgi:hypothetical protein